MTIKKIVLFLIGIVMSPVILIAYQQISSEFFSGGSTSSYNYQVFGYIGFPYQVSCPSLPADCAMASSAFRSETGLIHLFPPGIRVDWAPLGNDLTVTWEDNGLEYKVLLTAQCAESNLDPLSDSRAVSLGSSDYAYTFADVPDSTCLYFHVRAREKLANGSPGLWLPAVHRLINSRQMSVLKYYQNDAFKLSELNQGRWQWSGNWSVFSSPVSSVYYLGNSGIGVEKLYINMNTPTWKKYEFSAGLRKIQAGGSVSLIFKMVDSGRYCLLRFGDNSVQVLDDKGNVAASSSVSADFSIRRSLKLRIRYIDANGLSSVQAYLDDARVLSANLPLPMYGGVGIETTECQVRVDQIMVKPVN